MTNKSKIETTINRKRLAKTTTMIVKTSFVTIVKNRDTWKHIFLILRKRILKLIRSKSLKRLSRHVVFAMISTMRKIKKARVNHCCDRESIKNQRKNVKTILAKIFILEDAKWFRQVILIDEIAQINYILDRMTKTLRLRNVDLSMLKAKIFNKIKCRFIEIYIIELKIRNDRKREHVSTQVFYSFFEMIHNIIVRFSWSRKLNSHIDEVKLTWRYEIELDQITFDFLEKFLTR